MASPKPYKIDFGTSKVDRLKQKLALVELPDELEDSGWDYGSPLADIKRLVAHWQNGFDFTAAQEKLNELPQYTLPISIEGFETLAIHFVYQKSQVKNAIPLLFCHGWPGSFHEVSRILPGLVNGSPNHPAFHVVAPSLVNFGFSQGTKKKGFRHQQNAEMCHKLMLALGYNQYVTQGGDIGHFVTRTMGLHYPSSVKASHTNFAKPERPKDLEDDEAFAKYREAHFSDFEKAGYERTQWFLTKGRGYSEEHRTKPQTLGYSLADSPVGVLAWIYEKLHDWTDNYPWTDDEVLTWISIYYFSTAGPAAAQRIYYESSNDPQQMRVRIDQYIPDVKLGVARFLKELISTHKAWLPSMGPLVHDSQWDRGGHFAAWERPDAVVEDLRIMFGKGGGAFGAVAGKNGYDE